jgi:hypothetical protein
MRIGLKKQTKPSPQSLLGKTPSGAFGLGGLLPSQVQSIFAPQSRISYVGSWGSGKSVALCLWVLMHLAKVSYNRGFIGRLRASDLRDTTQLVWEEVVPSSWVKHKNRNEGLWTLKNGSQCLLGHLHDAESGKQHMASLNVAVAGIDQAEEVTEADYIKLVGRIRYRRDVYHGIFLASNPAGHNWIWRKFYRDGQVIKGHPWFPELDWMCVKENHLGIAVPIEENDPKRGGYLPHDYIPNLRADLPPEYQARYLDCSFDEFEGKVYPFYSMDSRHNLDVFEPDDNYAYFVGIDIGGSAPWAVLRIAVDFEGHVIVYDELVKPNMGISEVNSWIQQDPNWYKAQIVIDPENRAVVNEFRFVNPYLIIKPARKAKLANVARVNTLMQPMNIKHISGIWLPGGSPRLYITKNCIVTRRQHDERLWKPPSSGRGENRPEDGNDDTCDALEYVANEVWTPSQPEESSKLLEIEKGDPGSAQFWRAIAKKERTDPVESGGAELFEAIKQDKYDSIDEFIDGEIAESFWGGEL